MSRSEIAKIFRNGRSQAVRLPREFRFEGDRVRVRRVAEGVILQPLISNPREWFAELDRTRTEPFMPHGPRGRRQPRPPKREIFK